MVLLIRNFFLSKLFFKGFNTDVVIFEVNLKLFQEKKQSILWKKKFRTIKYDSFNKLNII